MSDPYIGQIIFGAFSFAPRDYALCDGSAILITQNQALYSLLSTNFGRSGNDKFLLPDLRGRVAVGFGVSPVTGAHYPLAQQGGSEQVALTPGELPSHTHQVGASTAVGTVNAVSNVPAQTGPNSSTSTPTNMYGMVTARSQLVSMADQTISYTGGGTVSKAAGHNNMQPFLVANAAIALTGLYPMRT